MSLLVKVIVLVLHYEGGITGASASLDDLVEWFLKPAADLNISHSCRRVCARFVHLVSLLCIVSRHSTI